MERVENSARTGDETYSPSNRKSSRGSEDNGAEDEFDDLPDEGEPDSSASPRHHPARLASSPKAAAPASAC